MRPLVLRPAPALFLAISLLVAPAARARALLIGGFTDARGGIGSFGNPDLAGLKTAINTLFPGSRYRLTGKLTPAFLKTVNVLLIGAAAGSQTPITPLSAKEQKALKSFVAAGGTALLFCDNTLQFQAASTSMVAPFGMATDGDLADHQQATFADSSNPIENGPAGQTNVFDTFWSAWFTSLGSATAIATLDGNGQPVAAYLPAGTLKSASGAVVAIGDSSMLIDSLRTPADQIVILNALALSR